MVILPKMAYLPDMYVNPEIYNQNGEVPFTAAEIVLAKFLCYEFNEEKQKCVKVLDVACGDGLVTALLHSKLGDRAKLSACDISPETLEFARTKYKDLNIDFFVWDACKPVHEELKGTYDVVFCNFLLHWTHEHGTILKNFYDLLRKDGNCMICFLSHHPMFAAYRIHSQNPTWSPYMQDVEAFITPYQDMKDPEHSFRTLMKECGFQEVDVSCQYITVNKPNYDSQKDILQNVDPFLRRVPVEKREQYMQEYMQVYIEQQGIVDFDETVYEGGPVKIPNYILIAFGKKK